MTILAESHTLAGVIGELVEKRHMRSTLAGVKPISSNPDALTTRIELLDTRIWEIERIVHDAGLYVSAQGVVVVAGEIVA